MNQGEIIFLTGFPGFIGKRLTEKILQDSSDQIILLIQPQMKGVAEKILGELDPSRDRIRLLLGDISQPNLGLKGPEFLDLAQKTTIIFHLAALYNLGAKSHLSYRVNVLGTRHVLYLAKKSPNLKRLNYFSTAYVAGKRRGVVLESELDRGQKFRNHYESTKFMAEMEVRRKIDRIPTTIYRPAIVVGDTQTGSIEKFDGPYYAIHLLHRLQKQNRLFLAPFMIPSIGAAEAGLNVVPVDFIVDGVYGLSRDPEAVGETFHLVDPAPMQVKDFRDYIFDKFGIKPLPITLPKDVLSLFELVPTKLWDNLVGIPLPTLYYLNDTPSYDTTQATKFLKKWDLICPPISSYLDRMVDFVCQSSERKVTMVSTPDGLKPL